MKSPEGEPDLDDWLGGWNLPKGYLRFAPVAATLLVLLPLPHEGSEEADDDAEEEGGQEEDCSRHLDRGPEEVGLDGVSVLKDENDGQDAEHHHSDDPRRWEPLLGR